MHSPLFGPIRQWGFLVRDLDTAMRCWIDQLGVGPWWGYRNVTMTSHFGGVETGVVIDVGLSYQNGVQIELIHQRNEVLSPYRAFYDTAHAQALHQFGYFVPDLDAALARGFAAGLRENGRVSNASGRYYYLDSPALSGLVVELAQSEPGFEAYYASCAAEAAAWDGSEPFRLVG